MELLQHLLPDSQQIRLENWHLNPEDQHLSATVRSTQVIAECPVCKQSHQRVHSRYERTLQDLTLAHYRIEAILQIRAKAPNARIIILTTYDTDEDIYRGLQAGASGYLLKDTTSTELLNAIRQVHSGKKYIPAAVALKLTDRIQGEVLTVRELEVLNLITQGKSNQAISTDLAISEGTVKFHVNNILHKLGVSDRTQAVVVALKRGLTRIE